MKFLGKKKVAASFSMDRTLNGADCEPANLQHIFECVWSVALLRSFLWPSDFYSIAFTAGRKDSDGKGTDWLPVFPWFLHWRLCVRLRYETSQNALCVVRSCSCNGSSRSWLFANEREYIQAKHQQRWKEKAHCTVTNATTFSASSTTVGAPYMQTVRS